MRIPNSNANVDCRINDRHVSYDDYMAHIRASANAHKPITKAEWQFFGVYAGLVLIATLIAVFTGH